MSMENWCRPSLGWTPSRLAALLGSLLILVLVQEAALSQVNVVEKTVLANGATVLTKVNPSSDIVALRVYLKVGPRYETAQQCGLSNLMLRLLQAGTESRSSRQIANDIDSIGAELSTDINKDYGGLALKTTRATFEQGLEIFLDCLLHPVFPEDRLVNERETILKEIRQEKDSLLSETFKLFQKEIYGNHPYAYPALGLEETVARFEREDVVALYEERLDPARLLFVAVGNFDPDRLRSRLEAEIGALPLQTGVWDWALDSTLLPLPADHQAVTVERDSEAEWMVLGFLAPAIGSPDYPVMKVLDSIMGGSMNSRLFTELRDKKGLAYQVGSTFPTRLGPGIFAAYIGAAPENHRSVVEGILAEVKKIQQEPVEPDELQRAKTYIKGTFIMSQETNMGQAGLYGLFEAMGMGYEYVDTYPEEISRVTAEQIQQAARRYLTFYTLAAIRPTPKPAPAESR